ncbi:hypothetical protein KIW84_012724 [Lathyrus oleraceus]|uniref:Citrate transporter-like domain-containing protein n=1 Tax=Pisum sativum TaxID=3888 RepID=A0A9D5BIK3_PEA|nr:hypothetical protein KIW84_012724 [Pisum sativum]
MALAPIPKVVLGSIAFAIFWILAVFPAVPFLPIGRTAGSLLGAMLMVIFRVITPDEAYTAIDLPILGLLFGTMVVSVYLERADMFKYIGKLLSWKSKGPKDLLCRICLISAFSSALFTNDTSCVVLTEFVLKIAKQHNLPPQPFLLALASSANIGSSATPIGNPQNLVIAVESKISFGKFLSGVLPAMLIGVVVNAMILIAMNWKLLSVGKDVEDPIAEVEAEEEVNSHQFSPATMSHYSSSHNSQELNGYLAESSSIQNLRNRVISSDGEIHRAHVGSAVDSARNSNASKEGTFNDLTSQTKEETSSSKTVVEIDRTMEGHVLVASEGKDYISVEWKRIMWKSSVYMITLGMLIAMLLGLNMSWTAITAALALVVLDFKDARPSLEKYMDSTKLEFQVLYGILLLGARVAASAAAISPEDEKKAWLILAWVSTIAGNLSLLGSAANLIVCEQARRAPNISYTLTFWSHLKFGLPSTLIVTAIGLTLIR